MMRTVGIAPDAVIGKPQHSGYSLVFVVRKMVSPGLIFARTLFLDTPPTSSAVRRRSAPGTGRAGGTTG